MKLSDKYTEDEIDDLSLELNRILENYVEDADIVRVGKPFIDSLNLDREQLTEFLDYFCIHRLATFEAEALEVAYGFPAWTEEHSDEIMRRQKEWGFSMLSE